MAKRWYLGLALAAGALGAVACGDNGAGLTAPPSVLKRVEIHDNSFTPETVAVVVGGVVQWSNFGPTDHTTTSDAGLWDSGRLAAPRMNTAMSGLSGGTFEFQFNTPGTFTYHDALHPPSQVPGFTGAVVVTP
ncbi:MAG TPA: hypothetical protein VFW66_02325 [Gemmatimonadales bacterium]|nr:hypothetical protein [Gemmatimonadales bacterium]